MSLWVENVTAGGVTLTDLLIKEKAKVFAQAFNIQESELMFSNGWLEKFKKRNDIVHTEKQEVPHWNLLQKNERNCVDFWAGLPLIEFIISTKQVFFTECHRIKQTCSWPEER